MLLNPIYFAFQAHQPCLMPGNARETEVFRWGGLSSGRCTDKVESSEKE